MSIKKSQAGFTLVEMMVVAAVIAVLGVGFASYMYQQTRQLNKGQSRENLSQMQITILNSSGKSEVLQQSESLQIQDLGNAAFSCPSPCWVEPEGSENCIFRCGDPGHPEASYCPASLPHPCVADLGHH